MRLKVLFLGFVICGCLHLRGSGQLAAAPVDAQELYKNISVLASDSMKGRGNHTPEILQATSFIAGAFESYGLHPWPGSIAFWQPFSADRPLHREVLYWNKEAENQFRYFTPALIPEGKKLSDFQLVEITKATDSLLYRYWNEKQDVLLWYQKRGEDTTKGLPSNVLLPGSLPAHDVLWVAQGEKPDSMHLTVDTAYREQVMFNVVGVLPGKGKPDEAIIFSAHYDHLGTEKGRRGDMVFNGANDNASGTTALLALARYYAARHNNERTLIFCAFAGEELGLLGSKAFAQQVEPEKIKAVINIEMIGRAQYGKNKMFITGAAYSNFSKLLRENLKGSDVKITMEPGGEKELFKRSDNYPFALKGIPAHTLMSSDDDDACYHKQCDEVERIDVAHMAAVINAIIKGCEPFVSGEQTPSRINKNRL